MNLSNDIKSYSLDSNYWNISGCAFRISLFSNLIFQVGLYYDRIPRANAEHRTASWGRAQSYEIRGPILQILRCPNESSSSL